MRDLNDYQKQYIKNNPFEENMVRYRRKNVFKYIKKYSPKKFLEIGCANDPIFNYLEEFDKFIVIEPAKKFFKNALNVSLNHKYKNNIQIINNFFSRKIIDLEDLDFIICTGLLHEINNPKEFLRDIYDTAGKNSIVHINVPNIFSFHRLLGLKAGIIKDLNEKSEFQKRFQQNKFFSIVQLKTLVHSLGFKIIDSGFITFKPFTHFQMQELIDKNILSIEVVDSLSEMIDICPEYGAEIYMNLVK